MPRYDVVDEAIIDAEPAAVFQALNDEVTGVSNWWMPHWQGKIRGDEKKIRVGSFVDITIHRFGKQRVAGRCLEMIENRYAKFEYFEGSFIGIGEWTFEPVDGKTKVRYRWNVAIDSISGRLVSLFADIGKIHSDVVQQGFKGMNQYLTQKRDQ